MTRPALLGYVFALAAACAWGTAAVVVRKGVSEGASPLAGAVISLLSGGLVLSLMSLGHYSRGLRHQSRAVVLFLVSGLASGVGVASYFFALQLAPVVVVSPVASTTPLLILVILQLFMQRLERVTIRIWLGGLLVVAGVALVSVAQYLQ